MGREVDVLSGVERRHNRQKLRGTIFSRFIKMDVEVIGDNEFEKGMNALKSSRDTE